jgi:hypothetical protein
MNSEDRKNDQNDQNKQEEPKRKSCCGGKRAAVTRREFIGTAAVAAGAAGMLITGLEQQAEAQKGGGGGGGGGGKPKMSTPIIECGISTENTIQIKITAGATGTPGGFSLQWMSCAALAKGPDGTSDTTDDNTWFSSDDTRLCKASFSGKANGTNWNLGPGESVTVVIGGLNDADPGVSFSCNEPLACETCYVFRAFAHATNNNQRSDFTANLQCETVDCEPTGFEDGDFCTKSQGFYSSGNAGRDALIACFGGDPTGAACTSSAGTPIVTIGQGAFTYSWATTGICVDVQPGGGVFLMDSGLANLRAAMGGGGGSGFFTGSAVNATNMGTGGGLASQAAALTLNIALSGGACSGFPAGYGDVVLCKFAEGDTFTNDGTPISAATAAALNGQSVSDVLAAANAYLGGNGVVPVPYGLANAADLNELVANLNLAFDGKDWNGDTVDDHECGGMTAFAESHLCTALA